MRRFSAIVCFLALYVGTTFAQHGYPYTQVPFTSVKITPNTFWGDRIHAAREVTIPLAFSKCESEHRYKNFVHRLDRSRQTKPRNGYNLNFGK